MAMSMSISYKIVINDRNYQDWTLYDSLSLLEVEKIHIDPSYEKLFSNDIFEIDRGPEETQDTTSKTKVLHSSVRSISTIPGILVLKGGKTFGKYKDKYLYKCIPDDKRFPIFTIPYALRVGFSKNIDNKYITFRFDNWTNKHPQGTVVSVLGDVDILSNYYEYQLYCKSLYSSIQNFNKASSDALKKQTEPEFITNMIEKYNLVDRTNESIYSIDSKDTTDYDDAFSITDLSNECSGDNTSYKISIYIANVPMWMEELGL